MNKNISSGAMQFRRTKLACYLSNVSMSVVAGISPLLFLTFRNLYGISFTMLGLLVLINFCTQLLVDVILSFYSHKFDLTKLIKAMPSITSIGLIVYAVFPLLFPDKAYAGLVLGTVLFSSSAGLAEVLISPVIAAIPSENPDREMSKLHSSYAWGVVVVVIVSTLILFVIGKENWYYLVLLLTLVPVIAAVLFVKAELPKLETPQSAGSVAKFFRDKDFLLCFFCIFFGGASECSMAQWSSSYLEQAMGIEKVWGDIFGVAMFSVMLGLGRTLYSQYGKNITKILLLGAIGATICYVTAAVTSIPLIGLLACALTGLCVSMLWPGTLIMAAERFPSAGVAAFALMAAGGDLGGAAGPQLIGSIADAAMTNTKVLELCTRWNLTAEQLGMKIGLTSAILFPLIASVLFFFARKRFGKAKSN